MPPAGWRRGVYFRRRFFPPGPVAQSENSERRTPARICVPIDGGRTCLATLDLESWAFGVTVFGLSDWAWREKTSPKSIRSSPPRRRIASSGEDKSIRFSGITDQRFLNPNFFTRDSHILLLDTGMLPVSPLKTHQVVIHFLIGETQHAPPTRFQVRSARDHILPVLMDSAIHFNH